MKELKTKTCEEIMTTVYKPIEFAVDGLIAQGLYILAGAPKVGKSWFRPLSEHSKRRKSVRSDGFSGQNAVSLP